MKMSVGDFLDYCCDAGLLTVHIYSFDANAIVWTGCGDEVPDEFLYCELNSFDVPGQADHLTLNIE
jgi:hypothetical protein